MASPWRAQRLTSSTTTIFAEMSALAVATGSVNLGQGFPDSDGPAFMLDAARQAIADGVTARLGVSGDALNVAAAAAAAGADVGLAAILPDDDLGDALHARVVELGISDRLLTHRTGQQGLYIVHADPQGEREFSYVRGGSVGSTLSPDDLDANALRSAGAVVTSGITGAISASAR
jgi:2-dehydro-3-deoxygluconokinase